MPLEVQVAAQAAACLAAGGGFGDDLLDFRKRRPALAGRHVRDGEALATPGAGRALSCRRRIHVPARPGTVARLPQRLSRQVAINRHGSLLAGGNGVDDGVGARHHVATRK
jgi:hypothetical protein